MLENYQNAKTLLTEALAIANERGESEYAKYHLAALCRYIELTPDLVTFEPKIDVSPLRHIVQQIAYIRQETSEPMEGKKKRQEWQIAMDEKLLQAHSIYNALLGAFQ